ncbi:hypothetical protein CC1G_01585 [Coprinopsis cinerea okayama7|uniref:Cytochrome P450 n=1 Tax=Coprinopsis cinerea (strain Okayama-7 / 130 / ATCC MYA-4618 / FGSC 9003) TaxID=240176 RepID=A8NI50_COPC7|nr:hypothetical protein CC1G_01585 [Coprinopsis cinerea okayama7\|eukprot:XP_001833908.2 hypothetical protein CC1G_01585 [Coprinopsis cinerea okayama7\
MSHSLCAISVVVAWILYQWVLFRITERKIRHIPTVGPDGFISSYIAAWMFMWRGKDIVQEGYAKYRGTPFKVPSLMTPNRWLIIASGETMVKDMQRAAERELSFHDALFQMWQGDSLTRRLADKTWENPYLIGVVRGPLTRNFAARLDDFRDEVEVSFDETIPKTDDWAPVQVYKTMIPIVCRATNRVFVGLPLCRDAEYCRIQETLTVHFFTMTNVLSLVPVALRSMVGRMLTKFPLEHARVTKLLSPVITERMNMDERYGSKWEGRPNDMISWLLDSAPDNEGFKSAEDISMRIILANMARPEYITPLRAEIAKVVGELGWTKEALDQLVKVDSVIKESSRLAGILALSMQRTTKEDFRFSNGVTVPKGFRVAVAAVATHGDSDIYEDAAAFNGFRFIESEEQKGNGPRRSISSLDPNFLIFGGGRSACVLTRYYYILRSPGRFFAVNEAKAILAYILVTYDIRLPDGQTAPPTPFWFGETRSPDIKAQVLFRERRVN